MYECILSNENIIILSDNHHMINKKKNQRIFYHLKKIIKINKRITSSISSN